MQRADLGSNMLEVALFGKKLKQRLLIADRACMLLPAHADHTRARSTFPLWDHLLEFQLGWQRGEALHPPGWGFDALSVPAWRWMGLSYKSLTTGNTNEPPLGMLRRKAKG